MEDVTEESSAEDATSTIANTPETAAAAHAHHAVVNFLLHTARGWTILLSSFSVLFLLMLGLSIYFCSRCFRRRKTDPNGTVFSPVVVPELVFQEVTGRAGKALLESSKAGAGPGMRRMIPHKNIITPERTIEFTVPTVSLHAQAKSRESLLAFPSTSTVASDSGSRVPMIETQFFPQFHLEDGTAPQVGFSLHYEVANQMLVVRVLGGNNFPEETELCYAVQVKVYPGRASKQKTREFTGANPIYNQDFSFHVRENVLQTKVLKLRVIGSTPGIMNTTKSLLGVVNMALKDIPAVNHKDAPSDFRTGEIWRRLEHPASTGEGVRLDVSLKWTEEPNPGLLVMKIREAYGLHEIMEAEYTTTYVKVTLQEQGKSVKSRKTRLIRWGSLPNYDDTFVVTIPFDLLSQISFTLTLIARGRLGSKVIVGKVNIGPIPYANPQSGSTSGNEIWEDMTHKPNVETSRWLHLVP